MFFLVDVWLWMKFLGTDRARQDVWIRAKVVFVVLAVVCSIGSASWHSFPRLHRFFRPILIISAFKNVRSVTLNMLRAVPRVGKASLLL